MSNVVIVPKDIARRADGLINSGVSASVIKGVELLLQENLHIDGGSGLPAINQLDCSVLLKKGTAALQSVPFDLLGVDVNCRTVDVRKAYKKLALKYHPDKNPKTTPLFQLIQAASTKLSDSDQRTKEAASAAQKRGAAGMRQENRSSAASFHNAFQKNQQGNGYSPSSFPSAAGTKPSAAPAANNQQSNSSQQPYSQPYPNRAPQQAPGQQQQQQQQQQQYAYQQYQFKQQPPQSNTNNQQFKPQQQPPHNIYGQPQQASYNAQYQQYMNQQRTSSQQQPQPTSQQSQSKPFEPNNNNKGRNYYEELLKEQYKKAAAAEERAREYASRRFAEQQQKFAGAGFPNTAAKNPFDYRTSQQQQSQPNLNPFRQANQQPAGSVPAANGNPINIPPVYDWKYSAADNGQNSNISNNAPSGGGTANTARTYRTGADGKVHVQQSFPAAAAAANISNSNSTNNSSNNPTNQRRLAVPKPYDFKFTSVASTVVELEWKTSQMHHCNLAVEFSWKEKFPNFTTWEIVEKLIRAGCCRKKNLKPKASYEFRVRSVEELSNGQLGNRSDWTEVLSIVLPTVEQTNYNPSNPSSQPQQQSSLPKMKAENAGNVEPTPTPDMTDSYGKKTSAAAKAAAQQSSTQTQPSTQPAATSNTNTATNSNIEKLPIHKNGVEKPPTSSKTNGKETGTNASNKPPQVRPRTPTQEKPSEEKVFKRFSSKSTLSKDDSGIFSPAQFQLNEKDLKPRSLDDSGPLQKKHSIQSNNVSSSSSATGNSPIEKTLNKYFSGKDKAMSSSQREAWGKQQQHQQQQQQQNAGKDKDERENKSIPTKSVHRNNSSGDDYSEDGFDEDVSEEEEVVRVDLDHAGQKSSASSLEDALLGSMPDHAQSHPHRKEQNKKIVDDEGDDILDESEQQTDSDYSSVASYQTSSKNQAQQRKLRPRREKKSASRASYPINNNTGVKLDAHGNPFEYFELDSSYDHMDTDEIQYYQLQPPSIGNGMSNNALLGNKKNSLSPMFGKEGQTQVNYRHPVHAEPYPKSAIKGYVKGDRAIVGCANCGDWVRVKIQMAVYDTNRRDNSTDSGDPGSARKKPSGNNQKAVWGWCLRTDGTHEFLRPIQGTRNSLGGALGGGANILSGNNSSVPGFSTPLKQPAAAMVTPLSQRSNQQSTSSSKKKMMSPPKESLQRGMTKANLGASAILNQSFFNLPKQTPTKEKMKKKQSSNRHTQQSSASRNSAYPSIDESEELETASIHKASKRSTEKKVADNVTDNSNNPLTGRKERALPKEEEQVEVWMECFDDQGHVYYYHEQSMISKWELPEWVEEEDEASGAKYYVHAVGYGDNITMTSTWTKPKKFARLIRSQQYAL